MTQAAYSQLLDELISEVAALRADFTEYKSAFPPPPPSDSWWLPLAMRNKRGSKVRELLYLGEEQIYAAFIGRGRVESWEKRLYIYIYILYVYLFLFFCSCFTNMICCVKTLMVLMKFIIWCLILCYVLWIQFQFLIFDLHCIFHTCVYGLFLVFQEFTS